MRNKLGAWVGDAIFSIIKNFEGTYLILNGQNLVYIYAYISQKSGNVKFIEVWLNQLYKSEYSAFKTYYIKQWMKKQGKGTKQGQRRNMAGKRDTASFKVRIWVDASRRMDEAASKIRVADERAMETSRIAAETVG